MIRSLSLGVVFRLESLDLWLESLVFGIDDTIGCLFSSARTIRCFFLVERRSWLESLIFQGRGHVCVLLLFSWIFGCFIFGERKGFDFKVDIWGWGRLCVLVFFTWDLQPFSSLLEEKVLILKVILLEREIFIWGRVSHLGVIPLLLGNDSFSLWE